MYVIRLHADLPIRPLYVSKPERQFPTNSIKKARVFSQRAARKRGDRPNETKVKLNSPEYARLLMKEIIGDHS